MDRSVAWGGRVSRTFLNRARWIVDDLKIGENSDDGLSKLLACMAWESAETFSPSVSNMAGSGATGLIQFMPSTARSLGTTTTELASMTAEDQLNFVWKYFAPYKGMLKTLSDVYMAILWPRAIGKPEDYVLWQEDSSPTTYRQNSGLDIDKDRTITKSEATRKVEEKLVKGLLDENVLRIEAASATLPPNVFDQPQVAREPVTKVTVPDTEAAPEVDASGPLGAVLRFLDLFRNQFAGVVLLAASLLLNPEFSTRLAQFTITVANGQASWGGLLSVVGLGLMVMARNNNKKPPPASK